MQMGDQSAVGGQEMIAMKVLSRVNYNLLDYNDGR